ncbi:DUF3244 domain-containing protein [Parabacteroides distasonis]|uniref:DUF3244 domain-containing protein n=1 Tax=Parabacteroides distasonis TaxID=823 RepID=UPI0021C72634|nr:DUF3244 domain-containing protein [Parabacteroides distasonis]
MTVQVVNEQGAILYNEVVSGEAGECVSISLDQAGTGCFYLVLEHRLGQLTGDFIIQIIRYYSLSYASFRIKQYHIVDLSLLTKKDR